MISVEPQQAVFFSSHKSKASARPQAERVTSLLVQRSNQETPRKQSLPRRTCTKFGKRMNVPVQLARADLKRRSLRVQVFHRKRSEQRISSRRTSCIRSFHPFAESSC